MADEQGKIPDYAGMTINERLFVAGVLDAFDRAVRARDRARMIALLSLVEVADPDRSVDTILDDLDK